MSNEAKKREHFLFEVRADKTDDGKPRLVGYAAKFNVFSEVLGWFREMIAPGAFADAILTDDVRALWNHDANFVLGRNRAGTLKLAEDETGLAIEIYPPDTQLVRDMVLAPIERGDVSQMSFGFEATGEAWDWAKEPAERTLLKVNLYDVSPVTYPAYRQTEIALRSFEAAKKAASGGGQSPPDSDRLRAIMIEQELAAAVIL